MTEEIKVVEVKKLVDMFTCPICKEKMVRVKVNNHMEAHIHSSEEYVTKKEYVTPCGCRFDSEKDARKHIDTNKKYCGYYSAYFFSTLFHVKHIDSPYNWKKIPNWDGVKVSSDSGIERGMNSYGPFVAPKSNSKYDVNLDTGIEKLTEDEFYEEAQTLLSNAICALRTKEAEE